MKTCMPYWRGLTFV